MERENMIPLPDLVFNVAETAQVLRCSENFVRSLINNNLLRAMKIGELKVRKTTIEEFLEKHDGQDVTAIVKEMEKKKKK